MLLPCLGPGSPRIVFLSPLSQSPARGLWRGGPPALPGPRSLRSGQVALWQLRWDQSRPGKPPGVQAGISAPGCTGLAPTSALPAGLPPRAGLAEGPQRQPGQWETGPRVAVCIPAVWRSGKSRPALRCLYFLFTRCLGQGTLHVSQANPTVPALGRLPASGSRKSRSLSHSRQGSCPCPVACLRVCWREESPRDSRGRPSALVLHCNVDTVHLSFDWESELTPRLTHRRIG